MAKKIYIPEYGDQGQVTWYTYDASGNLVVTAAPDNQDVNLNPSTLIFDYSIDGECFKRVVTECFDCTDGQWDTEVCYNKAGEIVPCPDFTDLTAYSTGCVTNSPICKKASTLYTVIDNTGTRFNWTMGIELYFTDGSTTVITQTPTAGWSQQLNQWVTLFQAALDAKCGQALAEARCNRPGGCGGLLPAPTDLQGLIPNMVWRYLQILSCPTCPAINRAKIVSINGKATEKDLVMSFIQGPEKRFDLCQDCGEEGKLFYQNTDIEVAAADKPICLFDCAEVIPSVPDTGCDFTLIEGCDQGVTPVKSVYIQYADCGDGNLISAIYELDPDGGLVEYTPVGPIDDCNGNTIVDPPLAPVGNTHLIEGCLEGGIEAFTIIDDNGKPLFPPKPLSDLGFVDCCPDTCISDTLCVRGFDYQDLDTWEKGSMEWSTPAGLSVDQPINQDNGFKGSWYTNLIANVNSNTGWTMTILTDVVSTGGDKPTFQITGPCDSSIEIIRNGGDTLTITTGADGSISGTFEDGGNDICSDCFPTC